MKDLKNASLIDKNISGIYLILSPSGKKYIGQSICLKSRLIDHKCPSRKFKDSLISYEFSKYNLDDFKYEILELCSHSDLNNREIYWINKINPELNKSSGGFSANGCFKSDDQKNHLSACGKKQWEMKTDAEKNKIIKNNLTGRKSGFSHTIETKNKISASLSGRKLGDGVADKISKSMKISMIGNKNGNKKVASYLNGYLVDVFDSLIDASKKLKINPSGISKVLNGKQKTAGGFFWKLIED